MDDNKIEKAPLLPLTDDLLKIRVFWKNSIPKLTKKLLESLGLVTWRALAEAIAIRLTVFNHRRGNEVFQLLISRFVDRAKWKDSEMDEIKKPLTSLEQRLMRWYFFLLLINECYSFVSQKQYINT